MDLQSLALSHSFHSDVLFRDAQSELSDPHSWGNPSTPNTSASIEDVAHLVSTCIRLDHSYQGPKDPEEVVRATLERDGLPYRAPLEPDANLSIRAFLATPRNGHTRAYAGPAHVPGHGRGDSDPESFGSTPRARMRERLHPHPPSFGTYGAYDGTSGSNETPGLLPNQHRMFESPTDRTLPTPMQAAQEAPLLFSTTYSTSPLSLTDTPPPPPGRSSARGSRQSSLERITTPAVFSALVQPSPARHSPLANPSPLSLSSIPLPELSLEGSPEETVPTNDINNSLSPAEQREDSAPSSVAKDPSSESSLSPPPPGPSSTPLDAPKSSPGTFPELTLDPTMPASLSDTVADRAASELSNEQQQRALEVLQHENARLQDLNLVIMWMREETKRHVERLHRDRIIMNGEEMERQNLVSPLYVLRIRCTYLD
jgi:hypothetical protein